MPRNRLIFAILVFVLVAAACGGDDSDPSDRAADERPETFTTSDSEPEDSPDDTPEVSSEADATTEGGQQDSAAPDTASEAAPSDSASGTEPQDSSQPVVRLGNRFEWCADVQAVWDAYDEALATFQVSEAALQEAQAAFDAATDELDRAEVSGVLDTAAASHTDAQDAFDRAWGRAVQYLGQTRQISNRERMHQASANVVRGDETFQVAVDRAWEALLDADSELAALAAAVPVGPSGPVLVSPIHVTPDGVLADLQRPPQRWFNRVAQEAAREVYSQADSALIAEVLSTTAVEIAQVVNEAAVAGMSGEMRDVYFAEDLSNASHILHYVAGSVLAPFDAAAYGAARAADPNVSTMVIDSPDAYVRSITHERVDVEYREVSMDIIYGDPTYYRYLIGEWPASDDIALATYIEREQAVYDALPAALELAREATAALEAAEQAEWARQRDAEQALQAALEELATGSDAYTTFKRSFEESCA